MASSSAQMKPFLPEFLSLSLAVVFVDNGYNEVAIKIPSVLPGPGLCSPRQACQRG